MKSTCIVLYRKFCKSWIAEINGKPEDVSMTYLGQLIFKKIKFNLMIY